MFESSFPVHDVMDGPGPSHLMREAKFGKGKPQVEPSFRWIHLPANNMLWVEASLLHLPSLLYLNAVLASCRQAL